MMLKKMVNIIFNLYDKDSQDKVLDDQKCGSPDQSEKIHNTLSDGVGIYVTRLRGSIT